MELVPWAHMENLHKLLKEISKTNKCDNLFEQKCIATLKLDGSNLSFMFEDRKLVQIQGRNSIIWKPSFKNSHKNMQYGCIKNMMDLPDKIIDYCLKIYNEIGEKRICIYGEVYQIPGQKFPSWHPFGIYIIHNINTTKDDQTEECAGISNNRTEDVSKNDKEDENVDEDNDDDNSSITKLYLDEKLYELFERYADSYPSFEKIDDFFSHQSTVQASEIHPPVILKKGTLYEIITFLLPLFYKGNGLNDGFGKLFEGIFITSSVESERKFKCKLKSGIHEEQMAIPSLDELKLTDEKYKELYIKLQDLFKTRARLGEKPMKQPAEKNAVELEMQVIITQIVERESTKIMPLDKDATQEEKNKFCNNHCQTILKEVHQNYEGTKVPFDDKKLLSVIRSIVFTKYRKKKA